MDTYTLNEKKKTSLQEEEEWDQHLSQTYVGFSWCQAAMDTLMHSHSLTHFSTVLYLKQTHRPIAVG